jgi:uncharacterized Zn finger protein (UPF0148 family)
MTEIHCIDCGVALVRTGTRGGPPKRCAPCRTKAQSRASLLSRSKWMAKVRPATPEAATPSKAQRIRELYAQGLRTAQIAEIVNCNEAYVRVAGRQRKNGHSPSDRSWRTTEVYKATRQAQAKRRYKRRRAAFLAMEIKL